VTVAAAQPDAPRNLQVMSSTWHSVELRWTPGFDGGYQQDFVIVVTNLSSRDPLFSPAGFQSTYNVTSQSILLLVNTDDRTLLYLFMPERK